jgi:hypothetical protein
MVKAMLQVPRQLAVSLQIGYSVQKAPGMAVAGMQRSHCSAQVGPQHFMHIALYMPMPTTVMVSTLTKQTPAKTAHAILPAYYQHPP